MLDEQLEALRREFQRRGLGARVGFGERPALLVVDMINGFTDPGSPLGADASAVVSGVNVLLQAARAARVPVIFTTCVYDPDAVDTEVWATKIPSHRILEADSAYVAVDPRLDFLPGDVLLTKHFPSAFFGTSLASDLKAKEVDTVVTVGVTTSGCVRATVVDGCSYGFRMIVPHDGVVDRASIPHFASLFDIDAKYGDVVSIADVTAHFKRLADVGRSYEVSR